ncbi:MAG TPA: polymorphic toxin type 6 domain-containing protein [Kofleriaceae bacterium]|nr:polymorphic toxin type 6 domain-containing protein [Kofleriaceae bacterium]
MIDSQSRTTAGAPAHGDYEVASAKGATAPPGKKRPAAGQSVKAQAEIRLVDSRWFGNLGGDGTYVINPAISATLGEGEHDIHDPSVSIGDGSIGSHVQLKVDNSSVRREAGTDGHSQLRFLARYQLKNRSSWKTPNMSFSMKAANTLELGGKGNVSGDAAENALIEHVKVQGGVEGNINNKLHGEAEAAIKEFSLGSSDEYFDHWHDIEMVVSSSGYAVAKVTHSDSRGNGSNVEVERHASSEQVVTHGGHVSKAHHDHQNDKVKMRLLK